MPKENHLEPIEIKLPSLNPQEDTALATNELPLETTENKSALTSSLSSSMFSYSKKSSTNDSHRLRKVGIRLARTVNPDTQEVNHEEENEVDTSMSLSASKRTQQSLEEQETDNENNTSKRRLFVNETRPSYFSHSVRDAQKPQKCLKYDTEKNVHFYKAYFNEPEQDILNASYQTEDDFMP